MPSAQRFSDLPNVHHRSRGDTLPDYVINVYSATGAPTNLELPAPPTGITFTMRSGDDILKVDSQTATLEVGEDGTTKNRLRRVMAAGDVDETGVFSAEFEVTYAAGKRTFPTDPIQKLEIQIHDDLNAA